MRIEILVDIKTALGEGPLWDVDQQRLYFLDIPTGTIFRCTADGRELRAWDLPGKVGSMAIRKDGTGAIVALDTGFAALDFRTGDVTPIADPEADLPATRLNDGKVDRRGRFFAGSMDMSESGPLGSLYRLDPDFKVTKLETGIAISNGPCWSPDDRTFYFHDSTVGEIRAYDYDIATGSIANRRVFAKLETPTGAADGSTVDAEGCLWNAQIFDAKLVRYRPDGTIDRVVDMPVKKITSVMFGGPDLNVLYVTSMAKPPLPHHPGDGVQRGSLFAIHGLGVTGLPEPRFAA
jgi:sugar lactone lactonase YvrE